MENIREPQADVTTPNFVGVNMKRIILASTSVRRADILRSVGWSFETLAVEVDESHVIGEEAVHYVERLARAKAEAGAKLSPRRLVLGADTTVVVDGNILGKPGDEDEARGMLRRLSGRWHEVLTGVALIRNGTDTRSVVKHELTRVLFSAMSDDEINWYVATGEPMGKAGAYAIQGCAALFVERIEGDYWNIVGLPVQLVYTLAQML